MGGEWQASREVPHDRVTADGPSCLSSDARPRQTPEGREGGQGVATQARNRLADRQIRSGWANGRARSVAPTAVSCVPPPFALCSVVFLLGARARSPAASLGCRAIWPSAVASIGICSSRMIQFDPRYGTLCSHWTPNDVIQLQRGVQRRWTSMPDDVEEEEGEGEGGDRRSQASAMTIRPSSSPLRRHTRGTFTWSSNTPQDKTKHKIPAGPGVHTTVCTEVIAGTADSGQIGGK
nr:hypothetical protein CFP56_11121 [Quercus suber]